uniref:Ig-like domain-containing protein n=1 Tax=Sinocyclocheilus rhinocerous TaxID=307959 RepID=A0A673NQT0_9TELE
MKLNRQVRKVTCVTVQQNPKHILAKNNNMVEIKCSHDDSNMLNMLWYQQKDTAMVLIVLSYGATGDPNYEDEFKDRFKLERTETLNGALKISDLSQSDSAVYYCAVSILHGIKGIKLYNKNSLDGNLQSHLTDTLNGVLKISDLSQSDSAVYYCAVSMHSAVVFIACLTKNQTTRHTGNTQKGSLTFVRFSCDSNEKTCCSI